MMYYRHDSKSEREVQQMQYIAFDSHKRYTLASVEELESGKIFESRIEHTKGCVKEFLNRCDPGSPVAVETVGNWYWIIDEIEAAGMVPRLVHSRKAKMMLAMVNKTDKLDARGLNRLQRTGTLPSVWIPPGELRDKRELFRTRMVLSHQRTRLKNRIHATLSKYGLSVDTASDAFGKRGRQEIVMHVQTLPPHTQYAVQQLLGQLDVVEEQISQFEQRMHEVFAFTQDLKIVMSLPGVGFILGVVIISEAGDIDRFPSAEHFASYSGTTPRVHASGGKIRHGPMRPDVNRYLKWAFVEAANSVCLNRRHYPHRHVSMLYERIRDKRGHQKAIGAVARHLAEATYWTLNKEELYREPSSCSFRPREDKRGCVLSSMKLGI
jgi:transposase